jgi:hypothetical protein
VFNEKNNKKKKKKQKKNNETLQRIEAVLVPVSFETVEAWQ